MSITPADAAKILFRAQLIDNRTFDAATCAAWADVLDPDLTLDVALAAVAHHQANAVGVYLTPAHVNDYRKQLRVIELQRLRDAGPPDFPTHDDGRELSQSEERNYRALWQEQIRRGATPDAATRAVDSVLGHKRGELMTKPVAAALEGMFSTTGRR